MKYVYIYNEKSRASDYGIGTYIQQIIELLKTISDIKLIVVESRSNCDEFSILEFDGYIKYCIPCPNVFIKSFDNQYYNNIAYLMLSIMPDSRYNDIVFLFNYIQEYYILRKIKEKNFNIKSIFVVHYQNWSFHINGNDKLLKKIIHTEDECISKLYEKVKLSYIEEKEMYQLSDYIICLSEYTKKLLIKEYNVDTNKLKYIPNTIVTNKNRKYNQVKIKEELHINQNEIIVLYVGRLDYIKRVDVVIDAFKIFNKKYMPNSHLIIVGEGDFSSYLRNCQGYWDKITFTGKLGKNILHKLYKISDIGILPSLHEQCSYVVLEMLSFGIPVIGSNTTGLKEMIEDEDMIVKYKYKKEKAYCDINKTAELMYNAILHRKKVTLPIKYDPIYIKEQIRHLILNCVTEKHIE